MDGSIPGSPSATEDHGICALLMILSATALSIANNVDLYNHIRFAICGLSLGIALCGAGVILPSLRNLRISTNRLATIIGLSVAMQIFISPMEGSTSGFLTLFIGGVAVLSLFDCKRRMLLLGTMGFVFFVTTSIAIHRSSTIWSDVLMSQQKACHYLARGVNPYTARYPNIYGVNTPLYAPGMVDADNNLRFGFGYPPLSLLMMLPAYLITCDIRYGLAAALAVSAVLIGLAVEGRLGVLAAAAMLAAPQWTRMLKFGWIEPVMLLNFSLMMFCACRWRRGLPWALGLFLATKQYSILALPLFPLLFDSRIDGKGWPKSLFKTAIVLAVINGPFFLWNPAAFVQSLVTAHFMQSFRPDALSFTAWIYRHSGGWVLPMWVALPAIFIATGESLWRGVRSPAGFAAAMTLVLLVFFAFNKQAFCNYYYFMIAAAWWSVAAAKLPMSQSAVTGTDPFGGNQRSVLVAGAA